MSFLVDNIELLESKKATEERATSHIMNEQNQQMSPNEPFHGVENTEPPAYH